MHHLFDDHVIGPVCKLSGIDGVSQFKKTKQGHLCVNADSGRCQVVADELIGSRVNRTPKVFTQIGRSTQSGQLREATLSISDFRTMGLQFLLLNLDIMTFGISDTSLDRKSVV